MNQQELINETIEEINNYLSKSRTIKFNSKQAKKYLLKKVDSILTEKLGLFNKEESFRLNEATEIIEPKPKDHPPAAATVMTASRSAQDDELPKKNTQKAVATRDAVHTW